MNNRLGTMYQMASTSIMEQQINENGIGELNHHKISYDQTYPFYIENVEHKHNANGKTNYKVI